MCVFMVFFAFSLVSCNDFLDKSPDNRADIKTPEQLSKLLVDGYMQQNYALLCELSSDNFVDNNSPDANGVFYNLSAFDRSHDEIFSWQPVQSSQGSDSPSSVWNACYHAIAVANHALDIIAGFETQGRANEVRAQKGEALLIRAYNHFVLVNVFCQTYKNDLLSKSDSGVPYITAPETKVLVHYQRSTVAENYKQIEEDLLQGLELIDDTKYAVPKYRFNKQAAYAFATRFYLYKRDYQKVINYATLALGVNPGNLMRNWNADFPTFESFSDGWINAQSGNNFLLISTYSTFNRIFGTRYGCNRDAVNATLLGEGPTWSAYHPSLNGRLYLRGSQEYGVFFPKIGEYFEYTDKISGIGFAHIIRAEFTAEETLLCRAEAYAMLDMTQQAVADLKIYDDARKMNGFAAAELTETAIRNFYKKDKPLFVHTFNTTKISPDFVITDTQKPIIDCVLHFRRIETLFDGYRWFDIKRFGIEITHRIGKSQVEHLTWNDDRRAIQIPFEVIAAGLTPNKRTVVHNTTPTIKFTVKPK